MRNNIILIGMPASGKSTLGKRLAVDYERSFIDTDRSIEKYAKLPIQTIVDCQGHIALRNIERKVIVSLQADNSIIATGGSVVYSTKAMRYLSGLGRLVYLKVSLSEVIRRVRAAPLRGLAKIPSQTIHQLYQQREKHYSYWANSVIDNTKPLTDIKYQQIKNSLSYDSIHS